MTELETFGISEEDYRADSPSDNGNFADVMHPQARYTVIQRYSETQVRVIGKRPRVFNFGVKNFDLQIEPINSHRRDSKENKKLADRLHNYLLHR